MFRLGQEMEKFVVSLESEEFDELLRRKRMSI